jgi:oligopeptidase A
MGEMKQLTQKTLHTHKNGQAHPTQGKNNGYFIVKIFPWIISLFAMVFSFLADATPIDWATLTPERLPGDVAAAILLAQKNISAIAAVNPREVTFTNTIEALERATEPLDIAWARASHLDSVANGEKFRAAYNEMLGPVSEFYSSIVLDSDLWARIAAFAETKEAKKLRGVRRRLFEETKKDFEEGGAGLPEEAKNRLRKIRRTLSEKTQRYAENVLDATEAWEKILSNSTELEGMPAMILSIMEKDAAEHGHPGGYRLTLHAPIYGPSMRYLKSDSLRRELWMANDGLCLSGSNANGEILLEILKLRKEEATLLGYENFADFVLSRRMARNGVTALQFTKDLHGRTEEAFHREIKELRSFKASATGSPEKDLEPWEMAYWSEERCRAIHAFDDEQLRPYFGLNDTLIGLFELAHRLYGVSVVERPTHTGTAPRDGDPSVSVWDEAVRYFDVYDGDGKPLGAFYMDLFPRRGKRSGAWLNGDLGMGHRNISGKWIRPLGVVAANVTPATANQPSLLTHREVETIFHEFGHLLHHLFGRVDYASLNGTNVSWDFVELPSQFLENWAWERECLDLFARHHRTGEPLPKELYEKMRNTRNYAMAMVTMRQLSMQKMDLDLHISYDDTDLDDFINRSTDGYTVSYPTKPHSIVRHFGHLFSDPVGYAAGYYSYKWAEVLDADAFEKFLEEGIFNKKTAKAMRRKILEKGNSEPAEKLYVDFRGRKPRLDALLRRSGLLDEQVICKKLLKQ